MKYQPRPSPAPPTLDHHEAGLLEPAQLLELCKRKWPPHVDQVGEFDRLELDRPCTSAP